MSFANAALKLTLSQPTVIDIAIIVTSTLGAVGQAGVPGPSFLVVAVLLAAGIPIEGLPLLFALDRIFDMIRTALNITGDAACAHQLLVIGEAAGDGGQHLAAEIPVL